MRQHIMRWLIVSALSLCAFIVFSDAAPAQTASFECERSSTAAERAICANPPLASADIKTATAYKALLSRNEADHEAIRDEQLAWLKDRDKRCRSDDPRHATSDAKFIACLQGAYDARLAELVLEPESQMGCEAVSAALQAGKDLSAARNQSIAAIAARIPGSPLRLGDRVGQGYVLKSTYVGSLNCQSPRLFKAVEGVSSEVLIPSDFGPEEGSHCGGDHVELASINGFPGLLDEVTGMGDRLGSSLISISLRIGSRWTDKCSLTIQTEAPYKVAVASCSGGSCGQISSAAEEYSVAYHRLPDGKGLPSEQGLSPDQRDLYTKMIELASNSDLARGYEIPFFGTEAAAADLRSSSGCSLSFDGLGGVLFPAVHDGELMLGKIGHDGFGLGAHSGGPDDAIALYRLHDGQLLPIAGFCVVAQAQRILSIKTN